MKFVDPITRRLPSPKPRWAWITISTLIPTAVLGVTLAGVFSESFRDWLFSDESGSTTIRNLGLVLAGLIALPLAIWRGLVAQKQADAAQLSLRNERYQKGAEMLGNERLSVRLGGIYALQRLAVELPEDYHILIMRLLCAFAHYSTTGGRNMMSDEDASGIPRIDADVQAVMDIVCKRDTLALSLEAKECFQLDFSNAFLPRAILSEADLTGTILSDVNLSNATLRKAILTKAILNKANLSSADLQRTELSDANLQEANLSIAILTGANFCKAKLQRANLTSAKIWATNFDRANLNNSSLAHTQIWAAKFPGAFLHGANLTLADLKHTDLSNGKLAQANLSKAKAQGINLSGANLRGSNLSGADLRKANLSAAQFWAANLPNTLLNDANLSGADFSGIRTPSSPSSITGLRQIQLNQARSDLNNPPKLDGALDAETGKPLVWTGGRGAPLKDDEETP